jgi:two-component system nitrate/nitrite response regulator NarL
LFEFCAARFHILNSTVSLDESIMETLAQHESVLLIVGSGIDPDSATRQIELFRKGQRTGRVVVLADHYDASDVISAFRAGASAYLVNVTTSALIKSLELVMLGETIMPRDIVSSFVDRGYETNPQEIIANVEALTKAALDHAPHLSVQEERILRFLVEGHSNKVIARKINIAEATVKAHIKAILRKVRVQNRTQAAVWAMNRKDLNSKANGYDNGLSPQQNGQREGEGLRPLPIAAEINARLVPLYRRAGSESNGYGAASFTNLSPAVDGVNGAKRDLSGRGVSLVPRLAGRLEENIP